MEPKPPRGERLRERVESKPPSLWRALWFIVLATTVFVVVGAVAMRLAEPEEFSTMGDALWFSVVTVSTVGYGDFVPMSAPGKVVASVIMIFGLAFVPAVTAIVINTMMSRRRAEPEGTSSDVWNEPNPADSGKQNEGSG